MCLIVGYLPWGNQRRCEVPETARVKRKNHQF